jgi:hypothetical protein
MINEIKHNIYKYKSAFSLAEVLASLAIGAMILVAVLGIYGRAQTSASAVSRKLDSGQLPAEVLQRIAEDLDKILSSGTDTKITIDSTKFDKGYPTSQLRIVRTISDINNTPRTFEEIIWQASFDYDGDSNGLTLYRSHGGMAMEDKLLDREKDEVTREAFIPICQGIKYFKIQAVKDANLFETWGGDALPPGIMVTISFSTPFRTFTGAIDVAEEDKFTRTIAVDRTRKINLTVEARSPLGQEDANQAKDSNSMEPNSPAEANGISPAAKPSNAGAPANVPSGSLGNRRSPANKQ